MIPIIVGDSLRAVRASQRLLELGINVQPLISPSVPNEEARLRFFVSCDHTQEQLHAAVNATAEVLATGAADAHATAFAFAE